MKNRYLPLLVAAAMIGIALLAVADIVPLEAAQFAPFALLALFPEAWLRRDCSCRLLARSRS